MQVQANASYYHSPKEAVIDNIKLNKVNSYYLRGGEHMINSKLTAVQSAVTGEKNGMIVLPGTTIQGMEKLYKEDGRVGREHGSRLSPANIAIPVGMVAAHKKYLEEPAYQSPINQDYRDRFQSLYLMLAAVLYFGWEVTPVLYEMGSNPVEESYREYFSRTRGFDRAPDRLLVLRINGRTSGVFDAESGILVPTADFDGLPEDLPGVTDEDLGKPDAVAFMKANPQMEKRLCAFMAVNPPIVKRMCALVRLICTQLPNPYDGQLRELFSELENGFAEGELDESVRLLKAEPRAVLPEDVRTYLSTVTDFANVGLVCGWPGENEDNILLGKPCLVTVPPDAVSVDNDWRIGKDMELVPPFVPALNPHYSVRPDRLTCLSGRVSGSEAGNPGWAEVTLEMDGKLHHRVYNLDPENCNIANPDGFVDLQANAPSSPFRRFNYLERGSTAAVRYTVISDSHWNLLPVDSNTAVDELDSYQRPNSKWRLYQRRVPVTCMALTDAEGTVLGSRYLPAPPLFMKQTNTRHVAFDLGSSRSVRLTTVKGTGLFDPPALPRPDGRSFTENSFAETGFTEDVAGARDPFMMAMTTMSPRDIREVEEFSYDQLDNTGAYIEPLVQRFITCLPAGEMPATTGLLARTRNWRPNPDDLFSALMNDTGTMDDARTRIGVEAAPKERLADSSLSRENRAYAQTGLRYYISTLFMEAIYQAARDGYSFAEGNLKFGVSFPDNGSDTGLTREVREAILGAAEYVNSYLAEDQAGGYLIENKNLFLYAENLATHVWHTKNPPEDKRYLGDSVATGTSDCGNTTLDFTMAVNRHAYSCSIPHAGHDITGASLHEAYEGRTSNLVDCFPGASPDLKTKARAALGAAERATQGRPDKRLGFSMTLGQLFNHSIFRITGPNADPAMHKVQKLITIREFISIPAVAATIARAVRKGDISLTSDVYIAPVGRGSLALDSTLDDFKIYYVSALKRQISRLLEKEFTGTIRFMSNNDVDKRSVAEGILYMMEASAPNLTNIPVFERREDLEGHYLDMVYGRDSSAEKDERQKKLRSLDTDQGRADYKDAFDALYEDAFEALMKNYTYDDFAESFNTWALTGRSDEGMTDRMIRDAVKEDFNNMLAETRSERKNLIMSYPGVEKEHVCAGLLDICLHRIAAKL